MSTLHIEEDGEGSLDRCRDHSRIGLWGEWSCRVERQRERPWGLGVFRVSWLGITVIVVGKLVLTVTRPVTFVDGLHR